jgi:hypothetical protein
MSTQYTPPRPRGFAPLFRGPYANQNMRVSDAERQAVADRLADHFGVGRLDHAEFDERIGRAMSAKTRADLAGLLDDLPETGAPAVPSATGRPHRRRPVRSFLAIALLVVMAMAAAHAALHLVGALIWAALLVAILVVATRTVGRSRTGHDQ